MANNNVIEKTNNLDKTIPVDPIGYLYTNETQAHQFIISCTRKGEKVRLTGSVAARFVTSQNTYFVVHGSIVDGNAVITLHQDCYSIPGHFDLAIFVTSGTETTVVYAAVGTVKRTDSEEGVITGEPLPTLDELLAVVRDAQQIVSDFDDIILVQDKQPTSETNRIWVQPQADEYQVPTYEEFENLKGSVDDSYNSTNMFTPFMIKTGGYYDKSGNLIQNESAANSIYCDEFLPTNGLQTLYYYRDDNSLNTLSFCTYDANKSFIKRRNSTNQYGTLNVSGVAYIRWSLYNGAPFKSTVQMSMAMIENGKSIRYLTENTLLVQKQIKQVTDYVEQEILPDEIGKIINASNIFTADQLLAGGYYNASGALVAQADSVYTEAYFPTDVHKTFYYIRGGDSHNTLSIIKYNSDKSSPTRSNYTDISGSFTVDNDTAFIRFSVYDGNADKDVLQISPYPLVDGKSANVLVNNVALSNNQLEQAKSYVDANSYGKKPMIKRHGGYGTSGSGFFIALPTFFGYSQYDLKRYINDAKNADVFRIDSVQSITPDWSERFTATIAGELECAIRLLERGDFAGGMMHGDERYTYIEFVLDGVHYDLRAFTDMVYAQEVLGKYPNFSELRVLEISTLYDPSSQSTAFATHGREYIFNADGVTIRQSLKWLLDEQVQAAYLAMITPAKVYTTHFFTDIDFEPKVCLDNYGKYSDAKMVTYYSTASGLTCSCEIKEYPSTDLTGNGIFYLRDNNGGKYNKGYFNICDSENEHVSAGTVTAGTVWKSESKYRFDFVETA